MTVRERTKKNIIKELSQAVNQAVEKGDLVFDLRELPSINLEVPREKAFGDFSTPLAMHLPKLAHKSPREIAEILVKNFNSNELGIESIEIAGPGFINFKLSPTWINSILTDILESGDDFGKNSDGEGQVINLEFVSANPTGPMHIGNARGGAIGDVLANIFDFNGFDVTKEFYINDAGNQIEKFSDSLNLRFKELMGEEIDFPEDLYQGADIIQRVKEYIEPLSSEELEALKNEDDQSRREKLAEYALETNIDQMKEDLSTYGIDYNVWFSEKSLHDSKQVEDTLNALIASGKTYEKDGAIWFKTSDYGSEKDDVLIRSNGLPTYFLVDIAYHVNKFKHRSFDYGINVWGADHYGHILRLKSALEALGISNKLEILTMQLVKLKKDDELVRISKRKGSTVSLTDLINVIGRDAARFFFNMRSPGSQLELDLGLAQEESNENPIFYVQYAHARISSILRKIAQDYNEDLINPELLVEPEEKELLDILSKFPEEVIVARESLDPSRLTHYAIDLASAFHTFYGACRVNTEDEALKSSRIALIKATKQVLKNCSNILGIDTPERM